MPPTQSPLRLPRPRPKVSHSSAGPQFASTPRFLISQETAKPGKEGDDIDADEPAYSTRVPGSRLRASAPEPSSRQNEIIEDSEDGFPQDAVAEDSSIGVDTGDDTPRAGGDIDADFEMLFGTTTERTKKRRISLDIDTPSTQRGKKLTTDPILTSSQDPPESPASSYQVPHRQIATAATLATQTPFRAPPPFKFTSQHLSSTQQSLAPNTGTPSAQPISAPRGQSPQRRKPAFLLPRSPSPSELDGETTSTIPTPFSPSSKTVHRRGRARANAPAYLPGGMAAEVRGWILEMGAKREQVSSNLSGSGTESRDYFTEVRVEGIRQTAVGSSGPVAFVEGVEVDGTERHVLLFGQPRSKAGDRVSNVDTSAPEVKPGSLVGIHRGLVWDVEFGKPNAHEQADKEKWLICMEWDLLHD